MDTRGKRKGRKEGTGGESGKGGNEKRKERRKRGSEQQKAVPESKFTCIISGFSLFPDVLPRGFGIVLLLVIFQMFHEATPSECHPEIGAG